MLITNTTTVDYWFGPMHLPGGVGQTLTLDDTSDTSLYLLDDEVADAVNTLAITGMITISSSTNYPRATGVPQVLHGDGSPNGLIYAPQGSMYMRRDNLGASTCLYAKTTGVESNIGWTAISADANAAPTGVIHAYGATVAPTGWLNCDGSAVSRTTQSALFAVIGTTYGAGDGVTTFNLPDLLGRIPVGLGSNTDVAGLADSDGLSEADRSPKHLTSINDPGHYHDSSAGPIGYYGGGSSGSGALAEQGFNVPGGTNYNTTNAATGITVGPGGTRPTDTPAYLVVNYIIKT